MTTHICMACDSPGDGNCPACHGTGEVAEAAFAGATRDLGHEFSCSLCGGNGHCQTCGGTGETEIGGEGG